MTEPTEAEKKNGWTGEELKKYLKQRAVQQRRALDFQQRPVQKPAVANSSYNPKRWI